jgi:ParB-like chromosome segregation protein Spo0J
MNEDHLQAPIDRIAVDSTLQPRVGGIDPEHVRMLEAAPDSWPPLVVIQQGRQYLLVDGFHRFGAAQNLGLDSVPIQVVDSPEDGDLHALAFALNAAHGRPLSLADRRAFAERLLRQHPVWADREIGRRCGVSSNTVGSLRERLEAAAQIEQPESRVGAGGYTYTVGTNPRQRQLGELPDVGLSEQVGDAVGRLFTSQERRQQRRIAHYLQRLAVALDDQEDLDGWDRAEDAAEACQLVLDEKQAQELGEQLGWASRNVLDVAIVLGYMDEG